MHVSSNSPFGANARPTTASTSPSPYHPYLGYGRSKLEAEQLVLRADSSGDLPDRHRAAARGSTGRSSPSGRPRGSGRCGPGRFPLVGDGTQRRSMVFTGNLVDGLLRPRWRRPRRAGPGGSPTPSPTSCRDPGTVREALDAEGCRVAVASPGCRGWRRVVAEQLDGVLQARGRYLQAVHVLGELKDTIACDISAPGPSSATSRRSRCSTACGRASAGASSRGPAGRSSVGRCSSPAAAGYFGTVVVDQLAGAGRRRPGPRPQPARADRRRAAVEFVVGDIRDRRHGARRRATASTSWSTASPRCRCPRPPPLPLGQRLGHRRAAGRRPRRRRRQGRGLSSSAIFGIPESNPVTEDTPPRPLEAYGRAKLEAEALCREAVAAGLDVTIVRPRTILGHGRLGIFGILFEFVAEGRRSTCSTAAHNRYQFVHADDLADACLRALDRPVPATYNIGAAEFGTMRETLEALVDHAGTGSRVRSLPSAPARLAMQALSAVGATPLRPYHWLLYGESLWFDTTRAQAELGWASTRSNAEMVIESYEWFLAHRDDLERGLGPPVAGRARGARRAQAAGVDGRRRPPPADDAAGCAPGRPARRAGGALARRRPRRLRRPTWSPVLDLAMTELRVRDVGGPHPAHRPPRAHRRPGRAGQPPRPAELLPPRAGLPAPRLHGLGDAGRRRSC